MSTHAGDKTQYAACIVFHHCSALNPNLTVNELWEYSLKHADAALAAKSHTSQLKPILMGTSKLGGLDTKGFLAIVNRDNDLVIAENYQKISSLQTVANRALAPTVKGLLMNLGMPVESANTVRDVTQNLVNTTEETLSQLNLDTTRILTGDPLIQKDITFEGVDPEQLLDYLKSDLQCDDYDQIRLQRILKALPAEFHQNAFDLIEARSKVLGMLSQHTPNCSSYLDIAKAYLDSDLNSISDVTGLTEDIAKGKKL
jgi:hypothetical protein